MSAYTWSYVRWRGVVWRDSGLRTMDGRVCLWSVNRDGEGASALPRDIRPVEGTDLAACVAVWGDPAPDRAPLLPCPFCGSAPNEGSASNAPEWYVIRCVEAECHAKPSVQAHGCVLAAEAWNERPKEKS